ncbi:MAG: CbiX/SirB N-terminal domain-containing protein [Gammaproteobacteria bacterium]|nr:CbiX/SirB N-terminal domain-containing protein [Gammaproteobacteria bacterium]MBU1603503.1 CbiX/SirB N-terminal domain-containing protein [Gammaproteobacteria bacterium]MBU2433023.1 CbiX/SirB N-terminal domain-containing protein [Gammaproteobacteria bacterium]MBU2450266.1 CbiX/SirB N-terminal domain-containing protein [Gammaproteobacteria bacterium]PKO42672.1 MAG: cobalamin biosynthesis protein CbiX [Betaproteobacteria bacterium HGW-Betaproteobacteria-4]
MTTALILFAHGARDPEWANPMRRVQAAVRQRMSQVPVELAFLEFMAPNLADCVAGLVAQGADRIVVMPMFVARGGHLKKETPEMIETLRSTYPNVEFSLGNAIGEHELVVQAMATAALEVAGL